MTETHTWVKHRDTGLFWQCPTGVLEPFSHLGWEPTDERPEEPNPAVDERRAWEAEQAQAAEAGDEQTAGATAEDATSSTPARAARRSQSAQE